jgi:3-oxoacyl-[acyl-carrier protein] reductase
LDYNSTGPTGCGFQLAIRKGVAISAPELTSLHAVVTGASSGIGRACALRFAQAGASLVIQAHQNRDALHSLRDEVVALGGSCDTVVADLSSLENCSRLVREAWRRKPIDIWLHCAGADVLTGEHAQLSFFEKLDLLWKVDVRGTIACCRAVGHRMHERGTGVVLTIGWDQANFGMEGDSGEMFAAIKGSVMSFTSSLARSLAPQVRVNCLAPGWIRTKWGETASGTWDERARLESLVGRWGEPADVAAAAVYLASPAASFITAQALAINGGFAGPHVTS